MEEITLTDELSSFLELKEDDLVYIHCPVSQNAIQQSHHLMNGSPLSSPEYQDCEFHSMSQSFDPLREIYNDCLSGKVYNLNTIPLVMLTGNFSN